MEQARSRTVWFPETGLVEAPVFRMLEQASGTSVVGPAIFQLPESTAVIGPGDLAELDENGNLHIAINLSAAQTELTAAEVSA